MYAKMENWCTEELLVRRLRRSAGVVLETAGERAGELGIDGEVVVAVRGAVAPVDGVEPLVE